MSVGWHYGKLYCVKNFSVDFTGNCFCSKLGARYVCLSECKLYLLFPVKVSYDKSHPLQRVEGEWNGDFRFGGKSTAASLTASKSLLL